MADPIEAAPANRTTDRAPDYTPPWWVSVPLVLLLLAPALGALALAAITR